MSKLLKYSFIIIAVLIFLLPTIFRDYSDYLCNVLIFAALYTILAVGLDLLMGFTGQISVGHAAFFGLGAYLSAILTGKYLISPLLALFLSALLCGLISVFIGLPILALKEYYLAMATLAFNKIIVTAIIGLESITGGASGFRDIPYFSIGTIVFKDQIQYYYLSWSFAIVIILVCLAIVKSPLVRILNAIHEDEEVAKAFGINCTKYKIHIFILVNMFASIAGSLYAHYMGFIAPNDFDIDASVSILVMVFLGGIGTIIGPALGALFLKILPEFTYFFKDYELLINGAILIGVIYFMPKGLLGMAKKRY